MPTRQFCLLTFDIQCVSISDLRFVCSVIADYPEILPLFAAVGITRPRGGAFSAHCMRIANAFDMIINMLNNEESLNEALNHLARQHVARPGIRAEHMKVTC
jgi:hemoglobin-like flavoprotein